MREDDPYKITYDPWPGSIEQDSGSTDLAALLGIPARSLVLAAGGPWSSGWERPTELHASFAGRIGLCAVIDVREIDRTVQVGAAVWTRQSPYPVWEIGAPIATIAIPPSDLPAQTAFLTELGAAVDAVVESQPPTWVICRTCSGILPAAYMFGGDMCDGCATRLHGVVF